ncbi:putative esterase/lipase/outer membrane autotransporter [Bradyrhizobium sp. ORS 278]|uniref:autotransporter domain-containing protein n=1 Tax=Bradyrhizobium sp. (strain ORS 278) TaxID=114615 RepID=UPI000150844E|nr:autotransporter domain-containing protein [Bradyrhizobium sp. ORS 278]CAL77537.1 putative esterase/lipase/outer membrane autotransporter [Bradyrhizobium sp. ORS 278]
MRRVSRTLLCVVALSGAVLPLVEPTSAQTTYSRIQAFGDSYADTGNLWTFTGGIGKLPLYPTGRFSGGTNFVDTTSALLGIPQLNYAIGGATSGATNVAGPGIPGFFQEWSGLTGFSGKISSTDLVEVSIGGNDARAYYRAGGSFAAAPTAAAVTAQQAMAGINALVGAGARSIVFTAGDVSTLPEAVGNANAPTGKLYSTTYNALMQASLANVARSGVRVEYVDTALIGTLIQANPQRYGFSNVGACPVACIGNPALQQQYLFYVDGVHLTSHGFDVLGQYIVNRLNAPLTFAPQGEVASISAMGFAATLIGKLDMFRETSGFAPSTMNSFAALTKAPSTKAPPLAPVSPWSFYMQGNGGLSNRQGNVASTGFNLDSIGGTIGVDYRLSPNAMIGAAFDYSNPKAKLFNNAGTTDANSYQLGFYGVWANSNLFAEALATIGKQDYRNTRLGVVDTITSNPGGTTFVVAGKTGYLFDAGTAKLGPIAGLTYARARVDGFTEAGDPALTLTVGPQTAETLVGSVGVQLRTPFQVQGATVHPYLNLTLDDDLIGNGRLIQYSATSAPLIVNNWNVPSASSHNVYGRVSAGIVAPFWSNVALTANVSRTIGRTGGDDFFGSGGLKISF